jgi:hypothetical protein
MTECSVQLIIWISKLQLEFLIITSAVNVVVVISLKSVLVGVDLIQSLPLNELAVLYILYSYKVIQINYF